MARNSVGQLEEFKRSTIWLDILDELNVWLEDVHAILENPGGEVSSRSLDRLGGNAEAFHRFEGILDYMITNVEIEQKNLEIDREKDQLEREMENGRS